MLKKLGVKHTVTFISRYLNKHPYFWIVIHVVSVWVLLFAFSCKSEENPHNEHNSISIVFNSIKPNYDTLFFSDGSSVITPDPVLEINKSHSETVHFISITDTIKIENVSQYIIVKHKFSPFSNIDFILRAGDMAHISYKGEIPYIDIINRKPKKYDVNYDYYKRQRYPNEKGMLSSEIIRNPSILWYLRKLEDENTKNTVFETAQEFFPILLDELNSEKKWLDSIFHAELISTLEYQFHNERNHYLSLNLSLHNKTENVLDSTLRQYNDSLYLNDRIGGYKSYFYRVAINYIQLKMGSVEHNNVSEIYDYLEHQNYISGQCLQEIKLQYLKNIMQNSPLNVRQEYFFKFIASVSDSVLIKSLDKEYGNLLNEDTFDTSDTKLIGFDGTKTSLSSILKEYDGYVVYMDFWASWCAPCRKMFPESKKLNKEFKDEKVLFLYLSLDKKSEDWLKVCKEEGLAENSYLILNIKESSLLKEIEIETIPRYLIYDKKGNIFHKNAPSPDNKNIRKIIHDLLKEKNYD